MPTLTTAARNAAADAIVDLLDSGVTDAQGDLVIIESAGPTDLCEINLQDPAFGNAGASNPGEAELQGTPLQGTAGSAGTADSFEFRDKDNSKVLEGTVTATGGGGDIELSNTNIASGDVIEISSLTITQPA